MRRSFVLENRRVFRLIRRRMWAVVIQSLSLLVQRRLWVFQRGALHRVYLEKGLSASSTTRSTVELSWAFFLRVIRNIDQVYGKFHACVKTSVYNNVIYITPFNGSAGGVPKVIFNGH